MAFRIGMAMAIGYILALVILGAVDFHFKCKFATYACGYRYLFILLFVIIAIFGYKM